jgi:hypothetical protein
MFVVDTPTVTNCDWREAVEAAMFVVDTPTVTNCD